MGGPKQMLWNIFCALVRPRTLELHWQQGNLVWTNSNMQNSMAVFFSSVLDWKHPFWVSLAQKMKIVSFSWNLIHSLTQIWRTQWWCSLFLFFNDTPFYGKFVSKNQNCLLKLKFGTQTNLNMLDLFCKYCPKNPFGILMLPN